MLKKTLAALLMSTTLILAPAVAQTADPTPPPAQVDPASCTAITSLQNLVEKSKDEAGNPNLEIGSIAENDKSGSEVNAQKAVKAYNVVFETNYEADGILILHILSSDNYIVGVIKGPLACQAHKMTKDEFRAFMSLASSPTA